MDKVMYERLTCSIETPTRCRKTARWWMDGVGYCDDHLSRVPEYLRRLVRHISYR